jgi:hypothetical protein
MLVANPLPDPRTQSVKRFLVRTEEKSRHAGFYTRRFLASYLLDRPAENP